MIHVLASISVTADGRDSFKEIFTANVPAVIEEDGCIEYRLTADVDAGLDPQVLDPNLFTVIEKWESLDHLKAHLKAPHMLAYRQKVASLVVGVTLKVLEDV